MDAVDDLVGHFDQDIVVETTIDPALQSAAEQALDDALAQKGDKLGVGEGALVAMTPDGTVRALVGGTNYAESQFNRAIAAKRQPGSAFKPFVYLTALEHGLTPDTVREDAPISVKGWKPENFEHEYLGPVTLTQALANSLNTVVGAADARIRPGRGHPHRLPARHRFDRSSPTPRSRSARRKSRRSNSSPPMRRSPMAALPSRRMWSSASAPPTARRSTRVPPQALGRIVDPRYVAMMNAMMRETLVSGTARRADLPGWQAAGKTGTSQDFRDAWFIGYTSRLVTGVWLGNDDNSPTHKATGGGLPVEIWSRFMQVGAARRRAGAAARGLPAAAGWRRRRRHRSRPRRLRLRRIVARGKHRRRPRFLAAR